MKNKILTKVCAVVTAVCFTMMVVSPSVFANVSDINQKKLDGISVPEIEKTPLNKNIYDTLISSKYGKVIDVNNLGSDTIVINIQDLHCDYFVQKNIYNIINELCEKYNIENIYAEGGIGTTDSGIFADINPAYKKTILENLLKSGRLTGTEYYSILNNKHGFLKGVEDEKSYNANIVRLSEILKSKQDTEKYLSNVDREIDFLKAKFLTSKNKKFNNLLDKYENKKISQKEFLSKLFAIAADNNINTKKYKNLQNYFALTLSSSDINKKSLTKEFTAVISKIKENVSYDEYKKMMALTSNFSDFPAAKMVIENFCNNKKINIAKVYPNLNKFLSLKKESLSLNPVAMVKEERKLVDTIRTCLSETQTELEIAYISDFKTFYKKYVSAELSSAQWEYVKIGLEKFEELYAKYSVQNDVAKLQAYSSLLTDFYNVNTARNSIFLSNMGILKSPVILSDSEGSRRSSAESLSSPSVSTTLSSPSVSVGDLAVAVNSSNPPILQSSNLPSLFSAKKIMILVSGGYHTEGITELLNKNNISNITITPEVANAASSTRNVYENLVAQQAMSVKQMIALSLITNKNVTWPEQIYAVMVSMFPSQSLDKINVNMLATHLNQIFRQNAVFMVNSDGQTLEISFADGTKQTIDIPAAAANVTESLAENKDGVLEPLELSSGSFKQIVSDNIDNWLHYLRSATLKGGQSVFAPEIYQISKDICLFLVHDKIGETHFYLGNGAVYDIIRSGYVGKDLDGVEPIVYEYMPEFMQKGLLASQEKKDSVNKPKPTIGQIIKSKLKSIFMVGMMLVLVLNMTACSLFEKNSGIKTNYNHEILLTLENRTFNDKISSYLDDFYAGEGRYKSFLYEEMPEEYRYSNVSETDRTTIKTIENLYDQALAALSFMQMGKMSEAEKILSAINNDGSLYKSNIERKQVTGEIVWVGIAAVQYKLLTGSSNYDNLIQRIDKYLTSVHKADGGYFGELVDSYVSTEHMLDIVAYLNLKTQYDDSDQIKKDLESAASYLYNNLYNKDDGSFKRGYNDDYRVLDVNVWAVQVLLALRQYNPDIYKSSGVSDIDINKIMEYVEKNFKISTEYNGRTYTLYKWSIDPKSPLSSEWTLETAVAYKLLGETEKAETIVREINEYSQALGFKEGYIPYSDQNTKNYSSYGWDVFVVPALCTMVGQSVQFEYSSFFFPLSVSPEFDYSSSKINQEPLIVTKSEGDNWRSCSLLRNKRNSFDLSNAESVTIKLRLLQPVSGAKVRLQYLPVNPSSMQNFEGRDYGSYWKEDFVFDENGELTIHLTMDEYRSCYAKAEFAPNMIDLEHIKIILNYGRLYFGERLNYETEIEGSNNVEVLNVVVKYNGENGEEPYEITYSPSVPSSILPSTFAQINNLIVEGSATTLNILKTILKAETLYSFFKPGEFIKAHPKENKGAVTLSVITRFSQFVGVLFTAAFGSVFVASGAGFILTAATYLAVFMCTMIAALFVNVTAHAIMDFRFIKSSGLREAIRLYGKERVSFNEDGTIFVSPEKKPRVVSSLATPFPAVYSDVEYNRTTYVITEAPENEKDFNFKPANIKIKKEDGSISRVWLGSYNGYMVVYSPGVNSEELVSGIINSRDFTRLFGPRFKNDFIQIDMINPDRELSYSQAGHIVVGENILKTGEYIDYRKEAALVANKKVDAVTINKNIAVFIDDSADTVSSSNDMLETINDFITGEDLGTNAKIMFSDAYIDKIISFLEQELGDKEKARIAFAGMIKSLKDDKNVEISIVFDSQLSSPSVSTTLSSPSGSVGDLAVAVSQPSALSSQLSTPRSGVIASETSSSVAIQRLSQKYIEYGIFSYVANGKYFDSITATETNVKMVSGLRDIESFDGSLSVLRMSLLKDEIENTSGIFSALSFRLNVSSILKKRTVNFVKQAAENFDFAQIPEIPEQELIEMIKSDEKNKFSSFSSYLDPSSQISMYYASIRDTQAKEAFTEEILKRALAVNYMRQHGIKYGLRDHKLEVLLANALYQSVIASEPSSTLSSRTASPSSVISSERSDERSAVAVSQPSALSSQPSTPRSGVIADSDPQSMLNKVPFSVVSVTSMVSAFKESVVSMKATEVEPALNRILTILSERAFSQSEPETIALLAIIDLIPLYADKNIALLDKESVEFVNDKTLVGLRAVLAAA